LKSLKKERHSYVTLHNNNKKSEKANIKYDNNDLLTYICSDEYKHMPLSFYKSSKIALKCFFDIMDVDNGGSVSLVEFTAAFKIVSEKLGNNFEYSSPLSLYSKINQKNQSNLTLATFQNASNVLGNDEDFVRILLAVDHVTNGSLGGICNELMERKDRKNQTKYSTSQSQSAKNGRFNL